MEAAKRKLLEHTHHTILKVGFGDNDYQLIADFISPNFVAFGTAIDEKIFGIKDLKALLIRQKEQSQGIDLNVELNTLHAHISEDANTAVFIDEGVLSVITNDAKMEMTLRLSMVLEYIEDKWLMVHFHSSKPEQVESEKDTWGIETWKKKAEELEKEVAQRTADLVLKNRDLAVEAALERVRARSMAMHSSEELNDVLSVMFQQIEVLGIDAKCVHLTLMDLENNRFSFRISGKSGAANIGEQIIDLDAMPIWKDTVSKWKKAKPHSHQCLVYPPEVLPDLWKLINNSLRSLPAKERIKISDFPNGLFDCEGHTKFGYIGFNNSRPPTEEEISIVIRFSREFERVYQRFLDIQKAEAQAREVQIQLCLERVRAKSMAMQSSNELETIIQVVHDQFVDLGITLDHAGFIIDYKSNDDMIIWLADEHKVTPQIRLPYFDSPHWNSFITAKEKGHKLFVNHLDFKTKNKFYKQIFKYVPELPEDARSFYLKIPSLTIATALCDTIGLYIENFSGVQYQEEDQKILFRFGEEFQQAYTRFLDLQKAEAQTREAQIQLSLERVRAKSMAMQSSDELHDVIGIVFQQFDNLGIQPVNVFLSLFDREKRILTYRASGKSGKRTPTKQDVDIDSVEAWTDLYNKWIHDSSDDIEVIFYPAEIVPTILNLLKDTFLAMPKKDRMTTKDFPEGGYSTLGYTPFGYLGYDHTRPPTEEEKDILKRICTEFGRVYQRFLDIQKAEAQAREAQIDAALERIRARSMAMQSSDELSDVLAVLFRQYDSLGIKPINAWLSLFDLENNTFTYRATGTSGKRIQKHQVIDLDAMDIWQEGLEQWKSGKPEEVIVTFYPPEIMPKLMDVFSEVFAAMPESERINPDTFPDGGYNVQGYCKFGYIGYNHTSKPTDEEKDIVRKFAKEFGRLYQRFLDIEKAEAQARESEIQLALERVRASSLAMQSSSDLTEVLTVLFSQFNVLGIHPLFAHLTLFDKENNRFSLRMTGRQGQRILAEQYIDINEVESWKEAYINWQQGQPGDMDIIYYPKEVIGQVIDVLKEINSALPIGSKLYAKDFPNGSYTIQANFEYGYIGFNDDKMATEAQLAIVKRFAKEFSAAYQRFIDIEKAEAQTREAQIEAALERVRSASMAMHKTEEISEVVTVLFDQLNHLNVPFLQIWITILNLDKDYIDIWMSPAEGVYTTSQHFTMPSLYFEDTAIKTWRSKAPFSYRSLKSNAEVDEFINACDAMTESTYFSHSRKIQNYNQLEFIEARHEYGFISKSNTEVPTKEEEDILQRFAKVFEQAYTRFLDIEKAEAQAREAQIEAAVERVRAKAMAMHSSDDFGSVNEVLWEQVRNLNVTGFSGAGILLFDVEDQITYYDFSSAGNIGTPEHKINQYYYKKYPLTGVELWNAYQSGKPYCVLEYDLDRLKLAAKEWESIDTSVSIEFNKAIESGQLTYQWGACGRIANGFLVFDHLKQPDEDGKNILIKMAKAFDLAFKRFKDLQKAEAQAREAQIETALEKVRSTSMAMHKSTEMQEVANAVYEQMKSLGLEIHVIGMSGEIQPDSPYEVWVGGSTFTKPLQIPYTDSTEIQRQYNKAISERPELYQGTFSGEVKKEYIDFLISESDIPKPLKKLMQESSAKTTSISFSKNSSIQIVRYTEVPYSEEDNSILVRFAKVFNQAYIRFLDLQKAEAQTREAQIEASLERIRAKSMAMHHPSELSEVLTVMFEQLGSLGVKTAWTHLSLIDLEKNTFTYRMTGREGKRVEVEQVVAIDASDVWIHAAETFKSENPDAITRLEFKPNDLPKLWDIFDGIFSSLPEGYQIFPEDFPNGLFATQANCKFGYIGINQPRKATEEEEKILGRFGNEFGRLYQRYLDIEKAQLQARKAQIEASLERVRAKAMAMHQTDELTDVLGILFDQFEILGINPALTHLTLFDEANDTFSLRITTSGKKRAIAEQIIDVDAIEAWRKSYENWKKSELHALDLIDYKAEDLPLLWEVLNEVMSALPDENKIYPEDFPNGLYTTQGHCKFGYLGLNSERKATEEEKDIVVKFAKEFGRLYQRFLDLQKAEAQAREAKIETALEKVRSRTMAMHSSSELSEVAAVLFEQISILTETPSRFNLAIANEEEEYFDIWVTDQKGHNLNKLFVFDAKKSEVVAEVLHSYQQKEKHIIQHLTGERLKNWVTYASQEAGVPFDKSALKEHRYINSIFFKQGCLGITTNEMPEVSVIQLLERFGKVFEQTYTRFLDLEKAEAQAREAQIEMSLEKVRSRTMAMQASSELPEAANTLFLEVQGLGIPAWSAGYCIWNKDKSLANCNMSSEGEIQKGFMLPTIGEGYDFETPLKKGEKFHVASLGGKKLVKHYDFMKTLPGVGDILSELINSGLELPTFQIFHICYFNHGYVMFITYEPVPNAHDIFKRFSAVFEQTYTRFLDLERAEAQTREAQIEMALEKVRSRTMAMQKGEELKEVVVLLYKELIKLGVTNFVTCGYVEINEATQRQLTWVTNPGGDSLGLFYLPLTGDATFDERYEAWKNQQEVFHQTVSGKVRQKHLEYAITTFNSKEAEEMVLSQFPDPTVFYCFNFPQGYLHIVSGSRLDPEEENLLARFTRVFEQTYTRFLDLERAEAQAKESQIEMALEKVRSRTMAMQHSDELQEAAQVLFNEVQNLGIPSWSCGYNILSDDKKSAECWMSSEGSLQEPFTLTYEKDKYFIEQYNFFKSNKELLVQEQKGKDLQESYEYMKTIPKIGEIIADLEESGISLPTHQFNHLCKFNKGYLLFITYEPVPDAYELFLRFTKVFEQTYTRFLDLKRAEAQAREAQIEAALERVRSQSMGMQSTDDFGAVTTEMFNQLRNFGEDLFATGIVFCDKHEGHVEQWHSIPGAGMVSPFIVPIDLDYIHQYRYDQWKKGEELFSIEIPGDFIEEHFEDIFKLPSAQVALKDLESRNAPMPEAPPWEIDYGASFEHGYVLISSLKPLENTDILLRFTKVFEQAYTRFLDLKRAEAQARESQIEAALEKVRSQSLSMQQPNELNEVVQLIAEKLQELDVILDLGGVVICTYFPDSKDVLHWIATPDSESSGKFLLPYFDHVILKEAWASKNKGDQWFSKAYSIEEKNSFFEHAFEHSDYKHFPDAAKKDILKRKHHTLSFAWSKHSALLIPSYSGLMPTETEKDILIRFAKVFEHAYIRFMDLQEKEVQAKALFEEKQRLEETLSDLQTTQKQLIQSEKMASLGELTAGIAHEIQNPLNFVNNFSEVSKELLEEMLEEIENGDMDEVKAIMEDVMQNLEKINHHGQRADGIVKGMLQHSRASGDKKEATDINALADEYLRLAYHGLRAKDKSFNAQLVTDFDTQVNKVKVIPQDLGRVILNLLTNAFYVVNEKKKSGIEGYEPTVSISTKKKKDHLEIKVADNGNGMPAAVKEKIFQPFFTTKPTGQGTGLGLSMSYDIITKGHGGELKVETTEGEGTSFIIKLPTK